MSKQPPKQETNLSEQGKAKAEMREQRRAASLRQNLRRRKMQQGGRQTQLDAEDLMENDDLAVPGDLEELE